MPMHLVDADFQKPLGIRRMGKKERERERDAWALLCSIFQYEWATFS